MQVRRLDPYEHPLVVQNDYLTRLGYTDIGRMQEQGLSEDLGYLVKFFAGKWEKSGFPKCYKVSLLPQAIDLIRITTGQICVTIHDRFQHSITKNKQEQQEQCTAFCEASFSQCLQAQEEQQQLCVLLELFFLHKLFLF